MLGETTTRIEFFDLQQTVLNLRRAGEYAGHAAAMITNSYVSGNHERVEVWEAEQAVWLKRQKDLIDTCGHGHERLAAYAAETAGSSFAATAVET